MKAIWFVSNYPHAANSQAGIFYKILADAMLEKDFELTIVAPTPSTGPVLPMLSSKWKQYADAPEEEQFENLRIFRPRYFTLPGETDSRFAHKRIISACLKLKLPDAKIIHGFGSYPINFAALQLAQMWDKPYIQTFIGSDVNDYRNRGDHQRKIFIDLCQQSQKLLAVSDDLRKKIHQLSGVNSTKVVMPISRPTLISTSRGEIRKSFGVDETKFAVLFAGSIIKEKGIDELLAAFENDRLTDCELVLAGPDPKNVSIHGKSIKTGVLQHDQLLTLMSACDVLILPSHNEGIPGVIKEAGQMKLPVIATSVGGIPEVMDETCGYLIPAKDPDSIVKSILQVKNNPDDARAKAMKLSVRITLEFDGHAVAQKMMDIYTEVIHAFRH